MYGEEAHEYINEQQKIILLSYVYYQSPCEILWESKMDVLPP